MQQHVRYQSSRSPDERSAAAIAENASLLDPAAAIDMSAGASHFYPSPISHGGGGMATPNHNNNPSHM